ncbi:MAG: hydrogenase 4 subunit F [Coriobacteriia bacterium]|nr:hydrogenase 4 subunit F [Coriobacteriia bacterium]MCL2750574.1 hydrogenase 4 subunit F [Coriobacteriia bacterium]
MDNSMLTIALIVIPFIAAALMAVLPSKSAPRLAYQALHMVSLVAVCVLSVYLSITVIARDKTIIALGDWIHLDALGAVFVVLIGVVGLLVGWYSLAYIKHDEDEGLLNPAQVKQYYLFFNLFIFAMLIVALSNNVIMMWVGIEITTLVTVFLVGIYNNRFSLEAAWKYIIVCTAGVAFGLYGTLLIYANGADIMADPTMAIFWTSLVPYASQFDAMLIQIAFVFIVIGFGTKAGLFPMHTWLPDAHSEAPSPISALLSGVLLKCAILVIIRFYILAVEALGPAFPQMIMLVIGIISVVVAALSVLMQDDVKRLLAYSSCENIGIIALCLGFGGPLGIAAALLHCVFHGLAKALLFCLSGNVLMKYGTRDLSKIKGILQVAPATAVLLVLGFFALAGFPPFALFVSKVLAFVAGVVAGHIVIVVIFGIAATVVIAACIRVVSRSVFNKAPETVKKGDVGIAALIPQFLMVALILWFGIAMPGALFKGVEEATAIVLQEEGPVLHNDPLLKDLLATDEDTT